MVVKAGHAEVRTKMTTAGAISKFILEFHHLIAANKFVQQR